MTSQYIKFHVVILFLTLILTPLLSTTAIDPAQATDPAQPQVIDPAQPQAQNPEDAAVMEKLSPFDKMVVYNLKNTDGLSPEETVAQAEFIYKMKTGAPLNPEEQEVADQMSPHDREVLQKELPKYNDIPPEGLKDALIQLQNDLRPKVEAHLAAAQQRQVPAK